MGRTIIALVALVTLAACAPPPPPPPPVAPPAPVLTPSCSSACANLERLGCPEARPTKGGLPCVTICERASQIQDMRLACITSAGSFTALRLCGTARCTE